MNQEKGSFSYPLMPEWSTQEIIDVSAFYEAVEKLNTVGIKRADFMKLYGRFCEIEHSKAAQKQLDSRYEKESGFSIYRSVRFVLENDKENLKCKRR